jgi:hypothetical protein
MTIVAEAGDDMKMDMEYGLASRTAIILNNVNTVGIQGGCLRASHNLGDFHDFAQEFNRRRHQGVLMRFGDDQHMAMNNRRNIHERQDFIGLNNFVGRDIPGDNPAKQATI